MFRNKMASQHDFAMIPRSDIPRSTFLLQQNRKTTMNGGDLVPIYCEEILPGDHFKGNLTVFARFATPITAVLDNAELETFFFYVPNRLGWDHWEDFMANENFLVPTMPIASANTPGSIFDQFGLPPFELIDPTGALEVNALPFRAYNRIYNEWFRDQNLVTEVSQQTGDGPDSSASYALLKRAKKHDYFTAALPWPQKGTAVSMPLGSTAPVFSDTLGANPINIQYLAGGTSAVGLTATALGVPIQYSGAIAATPGTLFADLSAATAATINALRLAFQVQRMLERDARGGTRYIELLQAHFGVRPPDFRLQRPEYIGGGKTRVNTAPIPQTSGTDITGQATPQGNLAGVTTAAGGNHKFSYAATEHGYIIGLANVRTDLTYQQGLRRHWSRSTRNDYYWPVFAHLGEQAILAKEIRAQGLATPDNVVFGYQERWAEYRYTPNEITGLFRSGVTGSIDIWHYAEEFATTPTLNSTFIADPSEATLERSMAVGAEADGVQILLDMAYRVQATRPMPTYSVPGLIDHF